MQFDQKTMVRVGAAIAVFIVAALFKVLTGSDLPITNSPATHTVDDLPAPSDERTTTAPAPDRTARSHRDEPRDDAAPSDGAVPPVSRGDFDYYVLVLSWSPTHCSSDAGRGEGNDMQCRSGRKFGFVLHGLWPQNERGYPQNCESSEPREMSAANMERALKIAPSEDLVRHEWTKHGLCSGLSQDDFVTAETTAFQSVHVPENFKTLDEPLSTTPDDVRQSFLEANSGLSEDEISATCSHNELAEVWVCLDKGLHPRACSAEVRKRHCGGRHVRMLAERGDWP